MSRRCIRCKLNIEDDAIKCPLCNGVLEGSVDDSHDLNQESVSVTYPDVTNSLRTMQFIMRLVTFAAIVSEVVVLFVNYLTFDGIYWSLIVGLGLCFGVLTLLYCFRVRRSIQRIVQVEMFLGIILLILLDYLLGGEGWSFRYALPILFVAVDIGVVVIMIVGIDGWQTYIMTEIVTVILSLILIVFHFTGIVQSSIFAVIALCITALILLGTFMFGQNMISNEVKRRFKI